MSDQQPLRMPDEQEREAFRTAFAGWQAVTGDRGVAIAEIWFEAWLAGRDWAREQAEQKTADADELEADVRDQYDRAAAIGRHLHRYYAGSSD